MHHAFTTTFGEKAHELCDEIEYTVAV